MAGAQHTVAIYGRRTSIRLPYVAGAQAYGCHIWQAHFYNDFTIEGGGLPRPACYLAAYDSSRRKPTFCMLIEDCMPAASISRFTGYIHIYPCTYTYT